MTHRPIALLVVLAALSGCGEDEVVALPPPEELTRDASGYYCLMVVAEHAGPKAQVFIAGQARPIWFPSVRDMLAYHLMPEETAEVIAIYVSDTGQATSYDQPAPGSWVQAEHASYVVGADLQGGMGLPEAVPFAEQAAAEAFAADHGGQVHRFDDIPPAWVFAEIVLDPEQGAVP
jgi:copper chaperone NosL